ncbi:hypothetical protein [Pseudomonas sp. PH1b]|uniref:hypothetical protein n=1 Tax=Pseudomonas sp. PH1b TaxID=1397282 RepID=UPI0004698437|nr:hypothetical protein [Pseudomonas sp. PH1b]
MQLNSARQAWHDAYHAAQGGQGAMIHEMGLLGRMVQRTEKQKTCGHQMHQAMAGRIQQAVDTLPAHLKAFGDHMYNPMATADDQDEAESAVFATAYAAGPRMYAKKFEKARDVARGVLHRYRRMHQGGQSEGIDPCPSPESFRLWLRMEYGLKLVSEQWSREWEAFIQACFNACNDLDKAALVPVSLAIKIMKNAA